MFELCKDYCGRQGKNKFDCAVRINELHPQMWAELVEAKKEEQRQREADEDLLRQLKAEEETEREKRKRRRSSSLDKKKRKRSSNREGSRKKARSESNRTRGRESGRSKSKEIKESSKTKRSRSRRSAKEARHDKQRKTRSHDTCSDESATRKSTAGQEDWLEDFYRRWKIEMKEKLRRDEEVVAQAEKGGDKLEIMATCNKAAPLKPPMTKLVVTPIVPQPPRQVVVSPINRYSQPPREVEWSPPIPPMRRLGWASEWSPPMKVSWAPGWYDSDWWGW